MLPPSVETSLQEGAVALGISLSEPQIRLLTGHLQHLARWNRVYNLTSVREPDQMVHQHLLDCLSVVAPLRRHLGRESFRLLDVGSGGGLPGVVVAVAFPEAEVVCVDAVGKKSSFIRQVAAELKLRNLSAEHARVERLAAGSFDVITARAFGSLAMLADATRLHLAPAGCWMAMKGRLPAEEMAALPAHSVEVFHVEPLRVPGLDAERHLVWMRSVHRADHDEGSTGHSP